ncbi:hypothetical protein L915_03658 [Phytophthora nicotianae]|uniref:DDE-1 domain-containing protein n=1 Tax=Phytophthora nicotianae TaxID=4792 RepID=W2HCX3_PHYNI|nr:hypothetical protein L915_03658 [Phytophthora nicotianae]
MQESKSNKKRDKVQSVIVRVRKELIQENANIEVERLLTKHKEEPFTLMPPSRADIAEWVSTSWDNLSKRNDY